ncbi:MAG: hypothetical protein ACYTEQ_11900 [Planctomycetota bacterium]|jgi:hypothetical protein
MKTVRRNKAAWVFAALCAVFLAGIWAASTTQAKSARDTHAQAAAQAKDPYEGARILVEAFIVEVNLEALYEAGVSPIGRKPESVSIESILQCLKDKARGRVTAGAKVAVGHNQRGEMNVEEQRNIKREVPAVGEGRPPGRRRAPYATYSLSKQFSAGASVGEDGKIRVNFEFRQDTLGTPVSDSNTPPNPISRRWENRVWLEAGRPSIVGATQNEETVVFLILCAHIENKLD